MLTVDSVIEVSTAFPQSKASVPILASKVNINMQP